MPDSKITALTALTSADPANDMFPIVDVSDTSMAASGTTKRISINNLLAASGTATLASATITGNLTVQSNVNAPASVAFRYGPSAATWAGLRFDSTNQTFLDSDIALIFRTGGATSFTTAYTIGATGISTWSVGGSTAMTLNATGLGLGASPAQKLTVAGSAEITGGVVGQGALIGRDGSSGGATYSSNTGNTNVNAPASGSVRFNVNNGVFAGVFDANANLGIGVTPSAWGSGFRYVQAGPGCAYGTNGSVDRTDLAANWYYNGGDKYINATGKASIFQQSGGAFFWLSTNTASGGAGSAMTLNTNMTLDASGNLIIGTTGTNWSTVAGFYYFAGSSLNITRDGNPSLLLNRLTSDGTIADFRRSGSAVGSISVTTTSTAYNTSSDYRLKESVAPLTGGLARVSALKPSIYKWKADGSNGEGFIAHELAEVVPAAVSGEKDAVNEDGSIKAQGVDLSKIVPILVAAIQELAAEVNALKNA